MSEALESPEADALAAEYEALLILHEGESLKLEFNSAVLFVLPVRDLLATA